jgi:putative oxidoreductase
MNRLITLHDRAFSPLTRADWLLPSLARLIFGGVLLAYFWASSLTKLGPGLLGLIQPSLGAYAQIFPRAMEAAGYDISQLGLMHKMIVVAGTWAEFILPLMILLGLMTRLAAVGMIGFILVMTVTDLIGHGAWAQPETLGAWFDRAPDSLIMDQRALWLMLLMVLVIKGAGPLSLDRLLKR